MNPIKKLKSRRGFSLAELVIVVAIIAILAGIAFLFVNPQEIAYVEYNRSAEAIATAVQNRLTEIRNAGDMEKLRALGVRSSGEGAENAGKIASPLGGESSDGTYGGYRYVYNYSIGADDTAIKTDMSYLLPFGAIEYDIAQNYYAIGFQSDTGMVGEVFYSAQPFQTDALTADYLVSLAGNPEKRKAESVGYYQGTTYDNEIAFANLPTPQLTITNHEQLTLSIYLPNVKQLNDYGKNLGILISLSDKNGKAFEKGLTLNQTAIYSTFSLGNTSVVDDSPQPIEENQKISSGTTYNIILDTVQQCSESDMKQTLSAPGDPKQANITPPKGTFESWAERSQAFKGGYYLLGDNSIVTVTVYCLYQEGDENYNASFPVDPTFMPRSASLTFNGWFNQYSNSSVDIACGRHLQNLGKMTELRDRLRTYLPTATKGADGVYTYSDYNYGMANTYTDGSDNSSPTVKYEHITEKYVRRNHVKEITSANQINAIDFNNSDWKDEDGNPIPFMPIYPSTSFSYYGNYLTISHLYVDAPFYAGLFGYAYHAKLYDILLVNPTVKSQMPAHLAELYEMGVGALIGTSRHSSDIYNCQVYMSQENKTYNSDYRVEGSCYVGGLIGFCEDEDIQNCSASVYTGYKKGATKMEGEKEISLSSKYVGGLIGCITGDCEIKNCYAAGNLTGTYVGGLIGFIEEDSDPSGDDYRVETCYTAGHIEFAEKEAAGILGYISELAGNAKGALSVAKNYCVIIYGEKEEGGTDYVWNSDAPIYPTFKGDGFEWLRTDQLGFSDTYLTGTYAGQTFFAGASFKQDNRNYYIAQRGIKYSNSPYYDSMYKAVKDLFAEIEGTTDKAQLLTKIDAAKQKIVWYKKLQTLEELKRIMETAIYEVENETGKDINGTAYNIGGYKDEKEYYLNLDKQNAEIVRKSNSHTVKLSAAQAIHAIYDGTYIDDKGEKQTITITDKDHNKADAKETGALDNFTFMGFYNALQTAYEALLDNNSNNDQSANETLKYIFGDNTSETYIGQDSNGNAKEYYYYQAGRFYASFYDNMLYKLFDVCKDYYDTGASYSVDDNYGELIYRHFRSDLAGKFLEVMVDLGMSPVERDRFLLTTKQNAIQDAIDELSNYTKITALWTDGKDDEGNPLHPMRQYASTINGYVNSAVTALQSLLTTLQGTFTTAQLQEKMDAAEAALKPLYDFFDNNETIKNTVDIISTDKDEDGNYKTGDMRNLRDPVLIHRRSVALCIATSNSSVENALDNLKIKVNEGGDITQLLTDFTKEVNGYLGVEWGFTDSGHRLKNSEEMRNAARGFPYGHDTDTREPSGLGFMYNYGESSSKNPYKDVFGDGAYVDDDHGVYNNVFPYTENEHTGYYPFPFVYGRSTQNSDGFRATYILFHYGDWLTDDLWANPVQTALSELSFQLTKLKTELQSASDAAGTSGNTGNIKNAIDDLSKKIESMLDTIKAKIGSATKEDLESIKNEVAGWLHVSTGNKDQDGVFIALKNLIKSVQDKPNMKDIVNLLDLDKYEEQLKDLISSIDTILTSS